MSVVRKVRRAPVVAGVVVLVAIAVACEANPPANPPAPAPLPPANDVAAPTTVPPTTTAAPTTVPPTTAPPTTVAPTSYITPGERLPLGGCAVFPRNNVFHATVTALPTVPQSSTMVAAGGGSAVSVRAGFGANVYDGSRAGQPTNVLDARTAATQNMIVSFDQASRSETGPVPWPDNPRFEGWPGRAWDKHLQVLDTSTCTSWELINVQPPYENYYGALLNRWYTDKIVTADLSSNTPRAKGMVTAANFSLLAGLVRYDEVASGSIDHVMTMSLPTVRSGPQVWPAMGSDGKSTDPNTPPMGSWLRLKSSVDLSRLSPQAKVVARALQVHGVVVGDTGPYASIDGEPDVRWNDADLLSLRGLTLSDFEVVDPTPMKVADNSFAIR